VRDERLDRPSESPDSEVEWEDLLLRIELMQRALRVVLEEVDRESDEVGEVLLALVMRERSVRDFLEAAAGLAEGELNASAPGGAPDRDPDLDPLGQFLRLRARNFAMVQRRGVAVWGWSAPTTTGDSATPHQVLQLLARADVAALAELRRLSSRRRAPC